MDHGPKELLGHTVDIPGRVEAKHSSHRRIASHEMPVTLEWHRTLGSSTPLMALM